MEPNIIHTFRTRYLTPPNPETGKSGNRSSRTSRRRVIGGFASGRSRVHNSHNLTMVAIELKFFVRRFHRRLRYVGATVEAEAVIRPSSHTSSPWMTNNAVLWLPWGLL